MGWLARVAATEARGCVRKISAMASRAVVRLSDSAGSRRWCDITFGCLLTTSRTIRNASP